jgi:hypothetical protein
MAGLSNLFGRLTTSKFRRFGAGCTHQIWWYLGERKQKNHLGGEVAWEKETNKTAA